MLSLLHIENIAVIEQADLEFSAGFHVMTGETGAGKSIVIDAISAILGERTYRDVIRTGADKGSVRALFTGIPKLSWFETAAVPWESSKLLIQRDIYLDGRNQCRVNGKSVTVALLRQLGRQLISIHGQHDSQQLFDEQTHLQYLDLFAQDAQALEQYRIAYGHTVSLTQEIERLSMDESEKARRMEILQHQIEEIDRAALQPGEEQTLAERRKILQNAEKLTDHLQRAFCAIYGSEQEEGALSLLTQAEHALSRIASYEAGLSALHEHTADLMYQAESLSEELRSALDACVYSAEELEEIEDRLDLIRKLCRKYGTTVQDVLAFAEQSRQQLQEIEFSSARIEELQAQREQAVAEAEKLAAALHETRRQAAQKLELRIRDELAQLDMPNVQFVCQFETIPLSATGSDQVRFLMSANEGEAMKPLSKIASGGELARIMLAIKNVMAEQDAVQTLIFDEVDAGVSGRAAQKVADKLHAISQKKQVLCVTHLPQIAAAADVHMLISKKQHDGRTYTSVLPLDRAGRIDELARIIGGAVITDTTRKSAAEMLPGKPD